ncbi:MAG: PAS domain S-box protein [Pseudomonadales bacterium]|nr:PAS domain S-box protein [Pseudomonadales bacterium]
MSTSQPTWHQRLYFVGCCIAFIFLTALLYQYTQPWLAAAVICLSVVATLMALGLAARLNANKPTNAELLKQHLYDSLSDGIICLNEHNSIIALNPAAAALFGYQLDELLDRPASLIVSAQHISIISQPGPGIQPTNKTIEFEAQHKDGSIFTVEMRPSRVNPTDHGDNTSAYLCRDISQHKQAVMQQSKNMELLAVKLSITRALMSPCSLQEQLSLAVGKLLQLKCLAAEFKAGLFLLNDKQQLTLSVQHGNLNESKILPQIQDWQQAKHQILRLINNDSQNANRSNNTNSASNTTTDCFIPLINPDLNIKQAQTLNQDNQEQPPALLGILYLCGKLALDQAGEYPLLFQEVGNMLAETIMQHKTQQAQLEQRRNLAESTATQNDKIKNQFMSNISHEIRTPMNHILGMLTLLLRSNLSDKQRRQASLANESARTLLDLVNDVLDLSRLEAGNLEIDLEVFNLTVLLDKFIANIRPLAEHKKLQLNLDTTQLTHTIVEGDPARIKTILTHLVTNAIKFTHAGEVTIRIKTTDAINNTASATNNTTSATNDPAAQSSKVFFNCVIEDTGIGIAPSKLDFLFSKFTQVDSSSTRAYGGTGIGLAICKNICELMNGNILVRSEQGTGSQFEFNLHLAPDPQQLVKNENIIPSESQNLD